MSSTRSSALRIRDLTVGYDAHPAVHHLDLDLQCGSLTAIVGPNGAGKTTLLNAISGHIRPFSGDIECDQPRSRIAYLPQQADLDRIFPISVFELVSLGAWGETGAYRRIGDALRKHIRAAIERVGLAGLDSRPVGSLSVGQFQRALFARVLMSGAEVILLDEPFNAIDSRTTRDLINVVRQWNEQRRTVIAVLHDLEQVRQHFPECLLIARERIAHGTTASVLTPENLARAKNLAEHWDDEAPWCLRNRSG